jgi:hypothetical protein
MRRLRTLSEEKPFEYLVTCNEEIIVYPSDVDREPQRTYALVITPFVVQFVKERIRGTRRMVVGASRDKPPIGSLGAQLKEQGIPPQHLSYLSAILVEQGFCTFERMFTPSGQAQAGSK